MPNNLLERFASVPALLTDAAAVAFYFVWFLVNGRQDHRESTPHLCLEQRANCCLHGTTKPDSTPNQAPNRAAESKPAEASVVPPVQPPNVSERKMKVEPPTGGSAAKSDQTTAAVNAQAIPWSAAFSKKAQEWSKKEESQPIQSARSFVPPPPPPPPPISLPKTPVVRLETKSVAKEGTAGNYDHLCETAPTYPSAFVAAESGCSFRSQPSSQMPFRPQPTAQIEVKPFVNESDSAVEQVRFSSRGLSLQSAAPEADVQPFRSIATIGEKAAEQAIRRASPLPAAMTMEISRAPVDSFETTITRSTLTSHAFDDRAQPEPTMHISSFTDAFATSTDRQSAGEYVVGPKVLPIAPLAEMADFEGRTTPRPTDDQLATIRQKHVVVERKSQWPPPSNATGPEIIKDMWLPPPRQLLLADQLPPAAGRRSAAAATAMDGAPAWRLDEQTQLVMSNSAHGSASAEWGAERRLQQVRASQSIVRALTAPPVGVEGVRSRGQRLFERRRERVARRCERADSPQPPDTPASDRSESLFSESEDEIPHAMRNPQGDVQDLEKLTREYGEMITMMSPQKSLELSQALMNSSGGRGTEMFSRRRQTAEVDDAPTPTPQQMQRSIAVAESVQDAALERLSSTSRRTTARLPFASISPRLAAPVYVDTMMSRSYSAHPTGAFSPPIRLETSFQVNDVGKSWHKYNSIPRGWQS